MARLSDIIEQFIKNMMSESDDKELEIGRNELANYFSCAPSQINYVLTTRFTQDRGYYIESRRGGGGCIRIRRVEISSSEPLFNIINEKIGNSITYDNSIKIINGLLDAEIIDDKQASIMKAAINERVLSDYAQNRNALRANILKSMIMSILL